MELTFGRFLLALALHVRGPEGEVVPQQLEEDVDEEETLVDEESTVPVMQYLKQLG